MSTIKLGSLILITAIKAKGRNVGITQGTRGIILWKENIMTNEGEMPYYKVRLENSTNKIITLAPYQFKVLGNPKDDPEMFI